MIQSEHSHRLLTRHDNGGTERKTEEPAGHKMPGPRLGGSQLGNRGSSVCNPTESGVTISDPVEPGSDE
jgi:hypothetical protein